MTGKGRGGDGIKFLGARNGLKYWEVRLPFVDPKTGKRRDTRRTIQADNKLAATKERIRLLEELKVGSAAPGERKRFGEALDAFLATLEAKGTKQSWGSYAKNHVRPKFGDWYLDAVTFRALQDHLDSLPLGKSALGSVKAIITRTMQLAIRRGWLDTNPARELELPKPKRAKVSAKADKRALTPDEAIAFLADLREHRPLTYPLVATQYILGCRFSEVSALVPDDVDLDTGLVNIRQGQYSGELGPTKGRYERLAAIPLILRAELKAYRAMVAEQQWPGWQEFFFPRPPGGWRRHSNMWSIDTVSEHIREAYERLGLKMAAVTHAARHTMVSVAAMEKENELILRKVVGHKSSKMTLNYTTAHAAEVVSLAERMAARLSASGKESGNSGNESG